MGLSGQNYFYSRLIVFFFYAIGQKTKAILDLNMPVMHTWSAAHAGVYTYRCILHQSSGYVFFTNMKKWFV